MEYIVTSCLAILSLTAVTILLIVFSHKETRLRKKVELLEYMIDNSYETDKIDINKL